MRINEKILQAVGNGDEKAFDIIYHEYATKIAVYIGSFVRNIEDAKDITQELFIDLPHLIDKHFCFEKAEAFKSWLYKVAERRALNFLKTKKNHVDIEQITDILSKETDKENEIITYITELKELLSKEEYKILILHLILEYTYQEIAIMLKTSVDKVKKKYSKIIQQLKNFYKE